MNVGVWVIPNAVFRVNNNVVFVLFYLVIFVKEIKSKDNKLIKFILHLNSSSSFRKRENMFFCEGLRLCTDAMKSGVIIKAAFFTDATADKYSDLLDLLCDRGVEVCLLSDSIFKLVSETQNSQNVAVLCEMPSFETIDYVSLKRVVALEHIQDPQNMGTILRSAEALGVDCIILSKDCCDIFSPKVLRGSMGAVFRQKLIIADDFYAVLTAMKDRNIRIYAAVPRGGLDILSVDFNIPCCAVIGNEGNGLSDGVVALCSDRISIKMNGNAESLNAAVASSIIMWEMIGGALCE